MHRSPLKKMINVQFIKKPSRLLWSGKIHYFFQNSQTLDSVSDHTNQPHASSFTFHNIRFNIIPLYIHRPANWSLPFCLSDLNALTCLFPSLPLVLRVHTYLILIDLLIIFRKIYHRLWLSTLNNFPSRLLSLKCKYSLWNFFLSNFLNFLFHRYCVNGPTSRPRYTNWGLCTLYLLTG